jgi:hypothetical protein
MRPRFRRPSHGTVAAYAALFVALGGTSYAAITLPSNSVGSTQIKKNAVTSSKVKNHSLLAADFASGELPRGATGAQGAAGPAGPAGPAGQAKAYGRVGPAGDLTRNFGISAVTHPSVGTYCLTPAASSGITVADTGLVATIDPYGGYVPDQFADVEFDSLGRDCPAGSFEVRTFANGTGGGTRLVHILADGSFFFTIP